MKTIGKIYKDMINLLMSNSSSSKTIWSRIKDMTPKEFEDNGWKVKGVGQKKYNMIMIRMCVVDKVYNRRVDTFNDHGSWSEINI